MGGFFHLAAVRLWRRLHLRVTKICLLHHAGHVKMSCVMCTVPLQIGEHSNHISPSRISHRYQFAHFTDSLLSIPFNQMYNYKTVYLISLIMFTHQFLVRRLQLSPSVEIPKYHRYFEEILLKSWLSYQLENKCK